MPKFLNETSKTGDGTTVKLGDTIEVDLFKPITAKITSISQHKNGKVFITGVQRNQEVDTWPSTIVQQPTKIWGVGDKNLPNEEAEDEYNRWLKDEGDLSFTDWKKAEAEVYTEEEFAQARARILKEDPTLLDHIYTPQKGEAKTWHVGDVTEHGYKIDYFVKSTREFDPVIDVEHHPMMASVIKGSESFLYRVGDLWNHALHSSLQRVQGKYKSWAIGDLVRFGHGKAEEDWPIHHFLIGDNRKVWAVLERKDGFTKLIAVQDLHDHKMDHRVHVSAKTKTAKPDDNFDHAKDQDPHSKAPDAPKGHDFQTVMARDDSSSVSSGPEDDFRQRSAQERHICKPARKRLVESDEEGKSEIAVEHPPWDFLTTSFFAGKYGSKRGIHTPTFIDTHNNERLNNYKKSIFEWVERKRAEPQGNFPHWPWSNATMNARWKVWRRHANVEGRRDLPTGMPPILKAYMLMCVAGATRQTLIDRQTDDVLNVTEEETLFGTVTPTPSPESERERRDDPDFIPPETPPDTPEPRPKPKKRKLKPGRFAHMLEDTLPLGPKNPRRPGGIPLPPQAPVPRKRAKPDSGPSFHRPWSKPARVATAAERAQLVIDLMSEESSEEEEAVEDVGAEEDPPRQRRKRRNPGNPLRGSIVVPEHALTPNNKARRIAQHGPAFDGRDTSTWLPLVTLNHPTIVWLDLSKWEWSAGSVAAKNLAPWRGRLSGGQNDPLRNLWMRVWDAYQRCWRKSHIGPQWRVSEPIDHSYPFHTWVEHLRFGTVLPWMQLQWPNDILQIATTEIQDDFANRLRTHGLGELMPNARDFIIKGGGVSHPLW